MTWDKIVSEFGLTLGGLVGMLILLFMNTMVTFQWRCGICGKLNHTNFIRMMLFWCDHEAKWHL